MSSWPLSRFSIGLAKPRRFTAKFGPRWKPRDDQSAPWTSSLRRTPSMRARCLQREIATRLRESNVCELKIGTEINRRKIADGNGNPSYASEELYSLGERLNRVGPSEE